MVYLIIYHSVFLSATLFDVFWSLLRVFLSLLHVFWSLLAYNGALSAALQLLQACFIHCCDTGAEPAACIPPIIACGLPASALFCHVAVALSRLATRELAKNRLQCVPVELQHVIAAQQCVPVKLQRTEVSLQCVEVSLQDLIATRFRQQVKLRYAVAARQRQLVSLR